MPVTEPISTTASASPVQRQLTEQAVSAGLEVLGLTAADIPGWHGIVVKASITSKKLEPLEKKGLRVCAAGSNMVIIEAERESESAGDELVAVGGS